MWSKTPKLKDQCYFQDLSASEIKASQKNQRREIDNMSLCFLSNIILWTVELWLACLRGSRGGTQDDRSLQIRVSREFTRQDSLRPSSRLHDDCI